MVLSLSLTCGVVVLFTLCGFGRHFWIPFCFLRILIIIRHPPPWSWFGLDDEQLVMNAAISLDGNIWIGEKR
jgi:hypothetical protein